MDIPISTDVYIIRNYDDWVSGYKGKNYIDV